MMLCVCDVCRSEQSMQSQMSHCTMTPNADPLPPGLQITQEPPMLGEDQKTGQGNGSQESMEKRSQGSRASWRSRMSPQGHSTDRSEGHRTDMPKTQVLKSQRNETLTRPRVKALAGEMMISKAPQDLIHQVLTAQSSRLKRVLTIQQMNCHQRRVLLESNRIMRV